MNSHMAEGGCMSVKAKNQWSFLLFCTIIGGFAGGVIWLFLKIMSVGTEVLWEWIPAVISGKITGRMFGNHAKDVDEGALGGEEG